ncbi:hypothetical protein AYI69_g5125 [Smittium culicis]|uniref:Uncharacterized protein n=1 Tax=Smittium culicis TaxID=133412 RepID=A0A1R1Y859_9FUNG|nr:hypothetical protein AYI69_g5125 [Smittium culicis]
MMYKLFPKNDIMKNDPNSTPELDFRAENPTARTGKYAAGRPAEEFISIRVLGFVLLAPNLLSFNLLYRIVSIIVNERLKSRDKKNK